MAATAHVGMRAEVFDGVSGADDLLDLLTKYRTRPPSVFLLIFNAAERPAASRLGHCGRWVAMF
jgi:hypothetical protein